MAQVRKIGLYEFRDVYRNHIACDFPPEEVKPLRIIKKAFRRNRYSAYVYEYEGQLLGYASFAWQNGDMLLLDYYAVTQAQRGRGIGSAFLKELTASFSSSAVRGIIFECEAPAGAEDEQERLTRQRRIRFYERCGVILTDTVVRVFGVTYSIMYLPVHTDTGSVDICRELLKIYRDILPGWLFRKAVKVIQK